jgi:hypothetical protein
MCLGARRLGGEAQPRLGRGRRARVQGVDVEASLLAADAFNAKAPELGLHRRQQQQVLVACPDLSLDAQRRRDPGCAFWRIIGFDLASAHSRPGAHTGAAGEQEPEDGGLAQQAPKRRAVRGGSQTLHRQG